MNSCFIFFIFVVTFVDCKAFIQRKSEICATEDIADTNIYEQTYLNSEPTGLRSNTASVLQSVKVKSDYECVRQCCFNTNCTAVYVVRNMCLLFHCQSDEDCKPKKMSDIGQKIMYIILPISLSQEVISSKLKKYDEDSQICELNVQDNCAVNEMCKRIQEDSRSGLCVCIAGYVKGLSGCEEETPAYKVKNVIGSTTTFKKLRSDSFTTVASTIQNTMKNYKYSNLTKNKNITLTKSTNVFLKVTNSPSKTVFADAGPDVYIRIENPRLSLSQQLVLIHGTATTKDGNRKLDGITYEWKRNSRSLAAGLIMNDSDHKATLLLTSLIQGQYIFELTVTDQSGFKASDTVNLFVSEKRDTVFTNLVDVVLDTDVYKFTEQELINFSRRMVHLIEKNLFYVNCQVHVKLVSSDLKNRTLITFYAESLDPNTKEVKVIPAGVLEEKLKMRLTKHKFIFDYSISKFQSRVCFNSCGGHGKCCTHNHRCKCNFPWLNNPWHEHYTGFSNCDMHFMIIVVVIAAAIFITVLLIITIKTVTRKCRRKNRFGKEALRYNLLENTDS